MKCDEIRKALSAFADGELSSARAQQIRDHLPSCTACSEEYRAMDDLRGKIQSADLYALAPEYLGKQISNHLQATENCHTPWYSVSPRFAFSIPAMLLGLVIGWAGMFYYHLQQAQDGLLDSLASAHIRSLMVDHVTDIASSDSHTVKPWFHGRLDFSPPVHDLTRDGYPLLGGRLDYLAGGSTAVLVYRHRQHTINLFITPNAEQLVTVKSTEYRGYNILSWDDGGLSYWVVSDLNMSDLEDFRALFKSRKTTGS